MNTTITRKDFAVKIANARVSNSRFEKSDKFVARIFLKEKRFRMLLADTAEEANKKAKQYIDSHLAYLRKDRLINSTTYRGFTINIGKANLANSRLEISKCFRASIYNKEMRFRRYLLAGTAEDVLIDAQAYVDNYLTHLENETA